MILFDLIIDLLWYIVQSVLVYWALIFNSNVDCPRLHISKKSLVESFLDYNSVFH